MRRKQRYKCKNCGCNYTVGAFAGVTYGLDKKFNIFEKVGLRSKKVVIFAEEEQKN